MSGTRGTTQIHVAPVSSAVAPDGPSRFLAVFSHGASDTAGGDPLPGSLFTGSVCCQPSLSSELISPAPARGQPLPMAPVRGSPVDTACWLASPPDSWPRPLLCSFSAPILMGFLYCSSFSNFQTDTLSGCGSNWTPFDTAVVSPRLQVCGNTLSISLGRARGQEEDKKALWSCFPHVSKCWRAGC